MTDYEGWHLKHLNILLTEIAVLILGVGFLFLGVGIKNVFLSAFCFNSLGYYAQECNMGGALVVRPTR